MLGENYAEQEKIQTEAASSEHGKATLEVQGTGGLEHAVI
jgi:hypothetical protein